MASALVAPIGLIDYLSFEEKSALRHEYVGGSVYAMTGGTMRHNRVALNVASGLMARVAGSLCQVFINDMKLHVRQADSVYYPDVFVACGLAAAGDQKVVHDAVLVVEVASESSAGIDRREKRLAYQSLPSLQAYWVVSQEERLVEVYRRGADGRFGMSELRDGDAALPAPGVPGAPLLLADLYTGTDLAD